MYGKVYGVLVFFTVFTALLADDVDLSYGEGSPDIAEKKEEKSDVPDDGSIRESFLNIKLAHERKNERAFGEKNTSAVGLMPVFIHGDWTIDGGWYYGRQFTFASFLQSAGNWRPVLADSAELYDKTDTYCKMANRAYGDELQKAPCYRTYTRVRYKNDAHNVRIIGGDTTTQNTIGFQQALSGLGISIYRQGGDGSIINSSSPIVITTLSKVECILDGEIISLQLLKPGQYSVNDLPEEAKIPGVVVKVSDQLGRSETLTVDFFSGYSMTEAGKDDFDVTILWPHKWDLQEPSRIKYRSKARVSANYRRGVKENLTLGAGLQAYDNSGEVDIIAIFSGKYGKVSPNVAYSRVRKDGKQKSAGGAGLFYASPENSSGLFFESCVSFLGKGFGDLGKSADKEEDYNAFIDQYFSPDEVRQKFRHTGRASSLRQIVLRVYSKPIFGLVPTFTFNGEFADSEDSAADNKLREYTLSLSTKVGNVAFIVSAGLTYDDPSKGRNQRSPDRRLTLAGICSLTSECSVECNYQHYDDAMRKIYASLAYTPNDIKGLELDAELYRRPGVSNPCFTVKYDNEFFGIKAEQSTTCLYEDKEAATPTAHDNRQRFYFGTSISQRGFRAHRPWGFNVRR
ncbi:MAG: hypothetical protein LBG20_00080 [Holosporaceae bacterium]|jgi:hypothetical protein|nr:hypothetical protein [Holosporaceae bacterium]